MGRWLLLLVAACATGWAVLARFGGSPQDAVQAAAASVPPASQPSVAPAPQVPLVVEPPPPPAESQDPLRQGDADAVAIALTELSRADTSRRAALEAAIDAAGAKVHDAATLRRMLGSGNAFLRSESGRKMALRLSAVAAAEAPEQGVLTSTQLLEGAMRGPIGKQDSAAQACVDAIYAAHLERLKRTTLNPAHLSRARTHEVQQREVLEVIARRMRKEGLKIEAGTLALVNRISDPGRLRVGQVLKIPMDSMRTVVEKRSFLMAVYLGDVIVRLYWVAHGKADCTPETTFVVGEKRAKPDWYVDGRVIPYGHPDNVLGEYFVKFEHRSFTGFGAHGTAEPDSIGTMASKGCLRLRDHDIAEYFQIVPRGSEVEIRANDG